jgi:hypothetical protein
MTRFPTTALLLAASLAAAGCGGIFRGDDDDGGGGGGTPPGTAVSSLRVELTDAPFENWMVDEATVTIDGFMLHEDANATLASPGFTPLLAGEVSADLTQLTNGVTQLLVDAEVRPGTYRQARVSVRSAMMRLINGRTFSTEAGDLPLGEDLPLGFRIVLDPPIVVEEGLKTVAILDFDLSKSFRPKPASKPLHAKSVVLVPVMRCIDVALAGELRGVVEELDPFLGSIVPVVDAFVHVLPPGETDVAARIATTSSDEDGSFAFLGLKPGTYDVAVFKEGSDRVNGVLVTAGDVATVDLELE